MRRIVTFVFCLFLITLSTAQVADKKEYLATFVAELYKQWPNNKTQNLVFHGHSVPTGYYTAAIGVRTFDSYPFYTLKSLKEKYNFAVLNCIITSIGGENAKKGATRFESDVLNHKPDVLFIDYSLNDRGISLEEARSAWVSMIEAALLKNIKVILCTPTPDTREDILSDNAPLKAHADQVRSLAAEYKIGLVDSYAIFKKVVQDGGNLNEYMAQNNHPNELGHRLVADEILTWFNSVSVTPDAPFIDAGITLEGSAGPATLIDYDADGLNDIIYSDGTNSFVYKNKENTTFEKVNQNTFPAVNSGNIINIDIDNNGTKELFFSGSNGLNRIVSLFEQNATKEWIAVQNHGLPAIYSQSNTAEMENTSVCFADINNDGYADFLANGINSQGETVSLIYINNKNKTFSQSNITNLTAGNGGGVTTADFNDDGKIDLILWGYNPTIKGYTYLYKNNGDGTFTQQGGNYAAQSWSAQVITGDFDGNGKKDFAMISWVTAFFLNNGDFSFTKRTDLGVSNYTRCSAVVYDFNNDENDDMIISGLNGSLSETQLYLFNKALGVYEKNLISDIGEYGCITLGNLNTDSRPDIFVSGKDRTGTLKSGIFFNTISTTGSEIKGVLKKKYAIFPNPTDKELFIKGDLVDDLHVNMYDMQGKVVLNKAKPAHNRIDCSAFADGSYIVSLLQLEKIIQQEKVTISSQN